jgi:hypothetical protein
LQPQRVELVILIAAQRAGRIFFAQQREPQRGGMFHAFLDGEGRFRLPEIIKRRAGRRRHIRLRTILTLHIQDGGQVGSSSQHIDHFLLAHDRTAGGVDERGAGPIQSAH